MKLLTSLEISSSDKLLSTKLLDKINIGQRLLLEQKNKFLHCFEKYARLKISFLMKLVLLLHGYYTLPPKNHEERTHHFLYAHRYTLQAMNDISNEGGGLRIFAACFFTCVIYLQQIIQTSIIWLVYRGIIMPQIRYILFVPLKVLLCNIYISVCRFLQAFIIQLKCGF